MLEQLSGFTGTTQYFKHFTNLKYTDGIKYLAEESKAYWLIDVIGSYQYGKTKKIPFQVWELKKDESGNGATVTMRTDSGKPVKIKQHIEFTEFPFDVVGDSFKLWLIDGVLLLPSEY